MIGTMFKNRYRLDAQLGQGGMGIVYRAHDTLLERDVAVKILSNSNIGTEGRGRMLREAQAAARLNHPNIVSIFDAGEEENVSFIIMELLDGDSLYEKKSLALPEILDIARQICDALEHAHTHGIIHRDLKPENVIITTAGVAKLTDFGLARSIASRVTLEGAIIGTIYYMSPEQALGEELDGRTDLYALGVMLYELTTGRLPFTADDPVAVISQHLYAPVIPPRNYTPSLPPTLDALIMRLLSKQRQDRPGTAAAVRLALSPEVLESEIAHPILSDLDQLVRGRLVGREREFALAKSVWRATISSPGKKPVMLITGESGVGKTPLVREIGALAEVSGALALRSECYPEGSAPYSPIAQVLREAVNLPNLELPDYLLADLIKIAPELRIKYPQLAVNIPADQQGEQQRLFDSVARLFTALTNHSPVLLILEDIQWADGETLFLLRHLARRARSTHLPLLLLLTYHEADIDSSCCLGDVLLDWNRELMSERIKLARYDRQQTQQVLETMFQESLDADFIEAIYCETEGNLFYIEEICKALIEQGKLYRQDGHWNITNLAEIQLPQSIRLTIQSRLSKLPSDVQEVLRLAAIIGREFDYQSLNTACDLEEERLILALETAERAQLIYESKPSRLVGQAEQGEKFAFAHGLIAATLKESTSGIRRTRLHRRVIQSLLALHPDDYEALAYHYAQANDPANAHLYYTKAGDRALAIYAYREAERYYQAALELTESQTETATLLSKIGESYFGQSRYEDAIKTWQEALGLLKQFQDFDNAALLYAKCGRAAWFTKDAPRGLALCREGLASIPSSAETPGLAALLHETARACYFNNIQDEALTLSKQALELANRLGLVEVQADTLATLGIIRNQTHQERLEYLHRAIELADSANLVLIASRAHLNLSAQLTETGEFHSARAHALQAYEQARKLGNSTLMIICLTSVSYMSVELGDFMLARQYLNELRMLRETIPGPTIGLEDITHTEQTILFMQGEWELVTKHELEFIKNPPPDTSPGALSMATLLYANSLVESSHYLQALEALEALQIPDSSDKTEIILTKLLLMGHCHMYLGNLQAGQEIVKQMEPLTPQSPHFYHDYYLQLIQANLAALMGEWDKANVVYQSLIEYTQQRKLRWYQGNLFLKWAEVLLLEHTASAVNQASQYLDKAKRVFEALPSPGYVRKIEKLIAGINTNIANS